MNNLLKFFIPKASFEIAKFFGFALALVGAIHLLPIGQAGKVGATIFIMSLLFPLVSYFNHVMYLPASLEWILLTPTKKLQIVFVHGILNIFKIILMYSLAILFFLLYEPQIIIKPIEMFLAEEGAQTFTRTSVLEFMTWFIIYGISGLFIFGILPNYVQAIQQRQNYHINKPVNEKARTLIGTLIFVVFGFLFLNETIESETFLPWLVKMSFIFVIAVFGAIYSTLNSLRFYFPKKKYYMAAGISLVLVSSFLYQYSSRDVKAKNLHVSDKIESLNFLGIYSSGLEKVIVDEFMASGPSLQLLSSSPLKNFFDGEVRKTQFLPVMANWEKLCGSRKDFTCRLAYNMHSIQLDKPYSLDLVAQGCPNDLGSCLILYDHKESTPEARQMATEVLKGRCEKNNNEFEKNFCKKFISIEKKKKK
jgi:hypothetical protein